MAKIKSAAIAIVVMVLFCAMIAGFLLQIACGNGQSIYGTRKIETLKIISVNRY